MKKRFIIILLFVFLLSISGCSLIEGNNKKYNMIVGEVVQLQTDEGSTFASSDEAIITVDNSGIVTALKAGEASVTIKLEQMSQKVNFVVSNPNAAYLEVKGQHNVAISEDAVLDVAAYNNGQSIVYCEISDESIASCSVKGSKITVTGISNGMTVLSIRVVGNEVLSKDIPIYVYNTSQSSPAGEIISTIYEVDGEIDLTSINETVTNLVKDNKDAVVGVGNYQYIRASITDPTQVLERSAIGSGVIYSKETISEGYKYRLLTNNHVIEDAEVLKVFLGYLDIEIEAVLLGTDSSKDLAALEFVTDIDITPCIIASSNDSVPGDFVIAIGNPNGYEYFGSVTFGMISYVNRKLLGETATYIQHDAAINPGNSGGPLFNLAGEVIGINTIKIVTEDVENMGFAINVDDVHNFLATIK